MEDQIYCPVCGGLNEISDLFEKESTFDWECEECGVLFAVDVEYEPHLYGRKIKWELCDVCLELVRDVTPARTFWNVPENIKDKDICNACIREIVRRHADGNNQVTARGFDPEGTSMSRLS